MERAKPYKSVTSRIFSGGRDEYSALEIFLKKEPNEGLRGVTGVVAGVYYSLDGSE